MFVNLTAWVCGVVSSAFLTTGAAAACLNDTSLPVEFQRSDVVFIGTVVSQRHVPPLDHHFDQDGDIYTLKAGEVFRGKLAKSVEIFSENSSGRFPMDVGSKYLLFAYREHGRMMVDNCGNSGLLPKASQTLAAVRDLAHSKKR